MKEKKNCSHFLNKMRRRKRKKLKEMMKEMNSELHKEQKERPVSILAGKAISTKMNFLSEKMKEMEK